MAGGYDGSIRIDSSIDPKGFNAGIKSLMGSLKGLAAAVGIAFGVGAVVAFGKAAVDAASEMSSAFLGLQSIMDGQGRSFSQAKKFINDYISDGLVPATNAITAYKNLAMRGYDTSQIEKILIALKNSSAFGRQASLTMGQAVQSATEGLKNENSILVDNAGVTKNVSIMWKEYAKSLGVGVESLTLAQKREAEINGILQETRFQMGDASKLAGTYAGQLAALGVSFTNLKVAFGNSLIPIITLILPYIRAAIDAMTEFFTAVAQVSSVLFGVQASTGQSAANLDDAAKSAADLMDNLTGSGKAAKGALASFDQLNVLQKGSDGGGTGPTIPPITVGKIDADPFKESLSEMAQKILEFKDKLLEFFAPAIEAFNNLVIALTPLGETIWAGLKWAWDNILVPFGTWVGNDLLPAFLDLLASGAKLLNAVLIALQPVATWLWENFLKPLGQWVGKQLIDGIQMFADMLKVITLIIQGDFAGAWELFKQMLANAWKNLTDTWGSFSEWFERVVLNPLKDLFPILWDGIIAYTKWAWNNLTNIVKGILDWIITYAQWAFGNLKDILGGIWNGIVYTAYGAWEGIKRVWGIVASWFKTIVVDPLRYAFTTALNFIKDIWVKTFTGIKDFIVGTINTIIDFVNGMIRTVVAGINAVIYGLNSIRISIPAWIPIFGGSTWGINIPPVSAPQIPRLATGAVIPPNSQFLAVLGDQKSGRNIEAPEGLIRQIINEEMGKVQADVNINFGGSMGELVRMLKPYIDKENVRIGKNLISAGVTR